jgi:multicomponent K+:H+ antiporter subunit D
LSAWTDHLTIAPIVIPLLAGTAMILIGEQRRALKVALGLASALLLLGVAVALLQVADNAQAAEVRVYRLGDWPSIFGIVLVLDRLSALMLVLTAVLGLCALVFALARWHRAGAHFHPLFQFQLMGLNGAFLTGDLFNLFVFFEVMLAASYGMALHGPQAVRVRAGLHYIAINLTASLLFLIGVSMIYGVAGTLNMAELAERVPLVAEADRSLLEAGAAVLGTALLIKAAMWPLGFWLPTTYAAASAPAAAILSILSKVGIYAILRLWLLLFGAEAGNSAGFGGTWLLFGGLLSVAFGCISVVATQHIGRLAGASVLLSSGTLLAAIGAGQVEVTGGALFYLTSSVLAIAAFFLLIELIERGRDAGADVLAVTREAFGEGEKEDPDEPEEAGFVIPVTTAILGMSFLGCALLLAGMPPLSGFLAKFAMLSPLFAPEFPEGSSTSWLLLAALLLSGMATILAMTRAGIEVFWASPAEKVPRVHALEIAPIVLLLMLCVAMTAAAAPVMRYFDATAQSLYAPQAYVRGVLGAPADADAGGESGQ